MRHNLVIEARLTLSQHDSGGDADKREENPTQGLLAVQYPVTTIACCSNDWYQNQHQHRPSGSSSSGTPWGCISV